MACDLTTGRSRKLCATIAGIKEMYVSSDPLGTITYDATDTDVITGFGTGVGETAPEFFKYELKGNNNNADAGVPNKDANNGTAFFAQSINVQLPRLDKATHKEFKLLVYNSPTVILRNNEDQYFVFGLEFGVDFGGGGAPLGGAKNDFAGYSLTGTAEERKPANFLAVDIETTGATVSAVQIT